MPQTGAGNETKISLQDIKNITEFKEKIDKSLAEKTTELVNVLLGGAITLNCSDIHLEPDKEKVKVRVRIDGILQDVTTADIKIYQALLSRIKLLSGIKLNITDKPQDGRFSLLVAISQKEIVPIEIRVSTLPAENGESTVLRILNPKSLVEMESLGLRKDLLQVFEKEIKKPNGMIIVTGPTGSGKTTTLYAFLKKIQRPEVKIITIEDPIEYHLKGVSQTQVQPKKGYDFASGLKSIMRQDPDVILVGEIRDLETVETALQAALTGHLVLSTLHTNDATGTVSRLISLGANPSNIGPAVNIAVAQRLVRKVCKKCSKQRKPTAEELTEIKKELKSLPKIIKIPQIKGCKYCNFTGYKGRIGIFEAFLLDDEIERFILTNSSIADLRKFAVRKGMTTIKQDGLLKVLENLTTLEEVKRVVG